MVPSELGIRACPHAPYAPGIVKHWWRPCTTLAQKLETRGVHAGGRAFTSSQRSACFVEAHWMTNDHFDLQEMERPAPKTIAVGPDSDDRGIISRVLSRESVTSRIHGAS